MYGGTASERGDIVLGWLARVLLLLSVIAVIIFDAMAIVTAHLGLSDDANSAAEAANAAWNTSHGSVQEAYNAAAAYADEHGETCPVRDFSVSSKGLVQLTLTNQATTVVVGHLGPIKQWAAVHAAGQATTPGQ